MLPHPQDRAAQSRPGWQPGVNYRSTPRAIANPRRAACTGIRCRARYGEIRSPGWLVEIRYLVIHSQQTRAVQPAARQMLSVDRLRTLHPCDPAWRRCARRTLVVGKPGIEGVRLACGRRQFDTHPIHYTIERLNHRSHRSSLHFLHDKT